MSYALRSRSGSLAILAAMRRASSLVKSFAARRPRLHPPRAGAVGADRWAAEPVRAFS